MIAHTLKSLESDKGDEDLFSSINVKLKPYFK